MSKNLYERRVKELMSKHVVSIHPHETIHDALQLMVENRISALPVVDGRSRCVGILSTSDLIDLTLNVDDELEDLGRSEMVSREWLVAKLTEGLGHQKVEELMTETPASVNPDAKLAECVNTMLRFRVHRLPVVGDDGRLLGILSTMDLLTAVADGAPT